MNMKKVIALGMTAAMTVGLMAGCGGSSSSDSASTASSAAAETSQASSGAAETTDTAASGDGVLNFGCQMYGDGHIDPLEQTNSAWNAMRYGITECLFKFEDDMSVVPWLAESYEQNDDMTQFVIKLKDGIKFSDGCDMTATKVKACFDRMKTDDDLYGDGSVVGSADASKFLADDAEIVADDEANTITINLTTPCINQIGNLAYPVCAIYDIDDITDWTYGVIGTGPYAVVSHVDLASYEMKANENYYEDVPFQTVNIIFMNDADQKANALKAGQVDLVENITNVPALQELQADDNYVVDIASGVRCGFSWMNMNEGKLLSDPIIREAILMAMDYDTICNSATIGGLYTAGYSVLPSTLSYGYENLTNKWAYNVDEANKILDDAGYVDTDGDGVREKDGTPINLTYVSYENRMLNDFSDIHTQLLKEIGIGVTADYGSSEDQWSKLVAGEYDFNNNNWTTVGNGDPTEYMANWYSKADANYCGYSNADYDAAYEALLQETDTAKRAELIQEMQQYLIDDAAVLVDGYYNSSYIYNKSKIGYAHIHTADYYWLNTEITPAE